MNNNFSQVVKNIDDNSLIQLYKKQYKKLENYKNELYQSIKTDIDDSYINVKLCQLKYEFLKKECYYIKEELITRGITA